MNIDEILSGVPFRGPIKFAPSISADEQKRILQSAVNRIKEDNLWAIGDFVTMRADSGIGRHGSPYIVVATDDGPFVNDPNHPCFGEELNTRIAHVEQRGEEHFVCYHWVGHHQIEKYTDAMHAKFEKFLAEVDSESGKIEQLSAAAGVKPKGPFKH